MSDTMTPEQHSRCMAAIRGKDTKPEMIVRKYLFSRDLRFRIQVRKLPGTPDIVLPRYKNVIFIDGCFWHGHEGCKYFKKPKSNIEFWERNISHNKARDVSHTAVLKNIRWRGKFALDGFSVEDKQKWHDEHWTEETQNAFDAGVRMAKKILAE